jgi:hypothetical protein
VSKTGNINELNHYRSIDKTKRFNQSKKVSDKSNLNNQLDEINRETDPMTNSKKDEEIDDSKSNEPSPDKADHIST